MQGKTTYNRSNVVQLFFVTHINRSFIHRTVLFQQAIQHVVLIDIQKTGE